MMRDAQRIDHMLDFVRRGLQILDGIDDSTYLNSIGLQEQVELNLLHLGEAAAIISDELKDSHPEIPWHDMIGMRNILVHEYFRIKPIVLFETVKTQFPTLERQLDVLQGEYPL